MIPYTYNENADKIDVTQDWVDSAQMGMNKLGKFKGVIKSISQLHMKHDVEIIDELAEFLAKRGKFTY